MFRPDSRWQWQFAVIVDQFATLGILRSLSTLQEGIVADLTLHPYGVDVTTPSEYVEGTWGDYLQRMAQHGTDGDYIHGLDATPLSLKGLQSGIVKACLFWFSTYC